jgi:thioredoxin-related protein
MNQGGITMVGINNWTRMGLIALAWLALGMPVAVGGDVKWRHNYDRAYREAKRKGLPLLVSVGTQNCIWCRRLEAQTLKDPEVVQLVNERYVPVEIDADEDSELARDFGVRVFPTLVWTRPDGKIVETHEGYISATRLLAKLKQALDSSKDQEADD